MSSVTESERVLGFDFNCYPTFGFLMNFLPFMEEFIPLDLIVSNIDLSFNFPEYVPE